MEEHNGSHPKEQRTILVVDDDQSILTFVSTVLQQAGYEIVMANSGEDALQKSREFKARIHLLLSNVQMTGITGVELGGKLTVERPDMRVMLMSGFTSGMLVLNEGWHFVHKPFIPSQLRQLVANSLGSQLLEEDAGFNEHKD